MDVDRLAEEIDHALAHMDAGDQVLLERDGRVVAKLGPNIEPAVEQGLAAYLRARAEHGPVVEGFLLAVEEARRAGNTPVAATSWNS